MSFRTLFLALATVAAGWSASAADTRIILPANVVPDHYDISMVPDAKALSYTASASIQLRVLQPTTTIVVNSIDIVIDHAALSGAPAAPAISYDSVVQTATFTFPQAIQPGPYVLSLAYHGVIYLETSGLFALDYDTAGGKKRALFTQFESTDARRFVPSWDEPGIKSTFTLTVTAPADMMAVSNMPIASTDALPGGLQKVRFGQSPKMSIYLLFLGIGDFERIHRMVDGVDVGIVVKRGDTASGQYALDTACNILAYYNDYFGTPYPLPKLDLIAGPGGSQFFGAMENWGAIFYFERLILFNPKISSEGDKRNIHVVIAHEMAHQWFGDLVTMAWWDNLWLNEGFASWMQYKATEHFHPEWKVWLDGLGSKQAAMQVDARDGTHPIIEPINDVLQASSSFDIITYSKGQAVIRMLEDYVGEDAFRKGVRNYMRDHAYGNTVTDDLWQEVDAVSDRKLTNVAHDFTLKSGVPVVTVTATDKGLSLSEDRFAYDSSGDGGGAWSVPTLIQPASSGGPTVLSVVDAGGSTAVAASVPAGSIVNAGQAGYYRVLYKGDAFTAISERFGTMGADDQVGILNDTYSFGCAGRAPISDFLELATRLHADAYPSVWNMVAARLESIDTLYDGLPTQAAYRRFTTGLLKPVLARTGTHTVEGEPANVRLERSQLLTAMGLMGDPDVVAEARQRLDAFVKDPSTLTGSDRESVLYIVSVNADQAMWDQIHELASTAGTQLEKNQLYGLLGAARDPALAQKAMAIALTTETDPTLRPRMITVASNLHPALALDFAVTHWDVVSKLIEPTTLVDYVPRLANSACDLGIIVPLEAFAAAHIPANADGDLRKAVSQIRYATGLRNERLPTIDRWLAARGAAAP
jgi:aminopeptidase N